MKNIDIISKYKVFTYEDYKRYRLSCARAENINDSFINIVNESWNKIKDTTL